MAQSEKMSKPARKSLSGLTWKPIPTLRVTANGDLVSPLSMRSQARQAQFDAYAKRRQCPPPRSVFKYRTVDDAKLLLSGQSLAFSSRTKLNDPFDLRWSPLWQLSTEAYKERASSEIRRLLAGTIDWSRFKNQKLKDLVGRNRVRLSNLSTEAKSAEIEAACGQFRDWRSREAEERIELLLRLARACCFSTDAENELMWSHYAGGHSGVVIEFDAHALERAWALPICPVEYRDTLPLMLDESRWINEILYGGSGMDIDQDTVNRWMLVKKERWEYEREWRAFCHMAEESGSDPLLMPFEADCILSVTVGSSCSGRDAQSVIHAARAVNPEVGLWRCTADAERFALRRDRV